MTGSPDDAALRRSLEDAIGSEKVRTDDATRRTYSTDASPCTVEPRAVAFAESEDDIRAVLQVCRELEIPITPRASGTSLSGAAIGPGVILDTTRFRRILAFDAERRLVRVEPGLLLTELNAYLADRGMRFAPDPGSQDLCRIGDMIGHNASGYRSVKYGQTRDHVAALKILLADGTAIGASRRPIRKHSCGFDLLGLAESLDHGVFPLASLFVGSEGTLGVTTEATLRVVPIPAHRVTLLLYLDRFEDLGPAVGDILPRGPSAIEAVDGDTLSLLNREALDVPRTANAMLLIEFDEGDVEEIANGVVDRVASRYRLSRAAEVASDPARESQLWRVRRSVFPTIIQRPDARKAWGFVEDPIVPRDRVPEFIGFLVDLARRHDTVAGIYGHIGDGNTHYRPFFDPTNPDDFERMQSLRAEFDQAVLDRFRGAPSGEHGIGRIRAETLPRVWGDEVYGVMRRIKDALDPRGLLNPGVLFSTDPWWATWGGLESRVPM